MLTKILACLAILAAILSSSSPASADVNVRGYYRSSGTYVPSHHRSSPDGYFYNNWSTKPTINPYTGRTGTRVTPPSGGYSPRFGSYSNW